MAPARSIHPEPLALVGRTDPQIRSRFLYLTAARVLVCTVIFGGTVAVYIAEGHSLDGPTPRLLLGVIVAIYVASLGYALQIRGASRKRLQRLISFSIAGDLLAWTVLAYATGGAGSPLSAFFGLSTLTAALVLGGNGTLWTAVTGLGAYATLGLLMSARVLRPLADQVYVVPSPIETTYQMVVTVTAVVLIAAIGGSLADRLTLTGDALVRSEASRANLSALYEDVLRSIPVALVTFDADGKIDGVNPFASALLRVDPSRVLGQAIRDVLAFVPDDVILGRSKGASGNASLTVDGERMAVGFHAAPLYDRDGAARGGLVVVDDRSHEEKLREAVQHAERFAVLGRLAAGLAHEIRNPLGAIQGCVELVRETATLDQEERELLATATRDAARLNDLVTDMLQFARPRATELAVTDVVALARDVIALAGTSGPIATVPLVLTTDPEVTARVDGAQVRQVLWNLLRNAAQVSRHGTNVEIEVRSRGDHVEVLVSDRGPGVSVELRETIFEAFYSGTARGTGLGLAIVKRIADAHHGSVEYRPRENGGSVFALRVPK